MLVTLVVPIKVALDIESHVAGCTVVCLEGLVLGTEVSTSLRVG